MVITSMKKVYPNYLNDVDLGTEVVCFAEHIYVVARISMNVN